LGRDGWLQELIPHHQGGTLPYSLTHLGIQVGVRPGTTGSLGNAHLHHLHTGFTGGHPTTPLPVVGRLHTIPRWDLHLGPSPALTSLPDHCVLPAPHLDCHTYTLQFLGCHTCQVGGISRFPTPVSTHRGTLPGSAPPAHTGVTCPTAPLHCLHTCTSPQTDPHQARHSPFPGPHHTTLHTTTTLHTWVPPLPGTLPPPFCTSTLYLFGFLPPTTHTLPHQPPPPPTGHHLPPHTCYVHTGIFPTHHLHTCPPHHTTYHTTHWDLGTCSLPPCT